jgi:hypothetical protein
MINRAQQIWEAFCDELTQEPTDDMREALATAFRHMALLCKRDKLILLSFADELEAL